MVTLYIDTHYESLVLVVLRDGKILVQKKITSNYISENAINLLKSILDEVSMGVHDLDEIIVINGPGSFTGVRIGVVIAKILAYTLNITVKSITYLQALALNYYGEVTVGISDKNGVFGASFNEKHELVGDYYYLAKSEVTEKENIIVDDGEVDVLKVYNYMKGKNAVNPHLLNPLYVKRIEVEKW